MEWEIEVTSEFERWWDSLAEAEQEDVRAGVLLLREFGPGLRFPFSSGIQTSKHPHMRELCIQHGGEPFRVLYAFDPRRTAILLIGGKKAGDRRWYESFVPVAGRLCGEYIAELK
ncbi:MAG: type II toxin-antitoxin system RelE/ParE family toxin [Acidobacteria bacterium]|nr:type II toxin-antitoxin system RelE/ParE family toxin [Acidobacteriota bacterium]